MYALFTVSRNKFVYSMPFNEQLKLGADISQFQKDLESLSKGIVDSLIEKEKFKVRSYDEARRLKSSFDLED